MTTDDDLARFDPVATYDDGAADYERASARFWGHLSRRTVERLAPAPGARVVDVPSGPGWSALAAAARVGPAGRVTAVDSSAGMLRLARRHAEREGLANLDYVVDDMTRLELPDASADAVVSVLGVFFVADMPALIARWWRLLRPGGQLAITTLGDGVFEPGFAVWRQVVAAVNPAVLTSFPWQRTADPERLVAAMKEAGVTDISVEVEPARVPLESVDDWWQVVMGSGMRRAVIELGDAAAEVRERCAAELGRLGIAHLEVPGVYAVARRG